MKKLNTKNKIHVKNGDIVQVISGNYKNQVGIVVKVLPKANQVIVKGINLKTKHVRPKQEEEKGRIVQLECPIHSSNVMLYSSKNQISSRYSYIQQESGKQRRLIKTREIIT